MPPETVSQPPEDWFAESFGVLYPLVYAHRSDEAAEREARFVLELLAPDTSLPLLDCGCGTGRHLLWLARHLPRAIGLDFSLPLLRTAREKLGAIVPLVRGDMRRLPFPDRSFGYACSFFTSFGYFEDTENARVLSEWARVLRPGGLLFLDYLNTDHVRRNLRPESHRVMGPWSIQEYRWIDPRARRVNKRVRLTDPGGNTREFHESVRLYEPAELESLLADHGLRVYRRFGGYDGRPRSSEADRLLLLARREIV
ncbi:MAG: class I SAM-dependent methyltransferase [Candidatus Hydrogenedentes bacterium]|nr:class I SAM-dependent methyltransferase [Candidatus Hydrogenedentota bacterium]